MNAVKPVPLVTPDGVERQLRCTAGATKRLDEKFGSTDFREIIAKHGKWALFDVAYLFMFDERGRPPEGLTPEWLLENTPPDSIAEMTAAVMSAATQGKTSKNEIEALILRELESESLSTGSGSKPSRLSASDSNGKSSIGESLSPNSTPTLNVGSESKSDGSELLTTAPA